MPKTTDSKLCTCRCHFPGGARVAHMVACCCPHQTKKGKVCDRCLMERRQEREQRLSDSLNARLTEALDAEMAMLVQPIPARPLTYEDLQEAMEKIRSEEFIQKVMQLRKDAGLDAV